MRRRTWATVLLATLALAACGSDKAPARLGLIRPTTTQPPTPTLPPPAPLEPLPLPDALARPVTSLPPTTSPPPPPTATPPPPATSTTTSLPATTVPEWVVLSSIGGTGNGKGPTFHVNGGQLRATWQATGQASFYISQPGGTRGSIAECGAPGCSTTGYPNLGAGDYFLEVVAPVATRWGFTLEEQK